MSRDILHHIVVYQCPPTINMDGLIRGVECGSAPTPNHFQQCISGAISMAWVRHLFYVHSKFCLVLFNSFYYIGRWWK